MIARIVISVATLWTILAIITPMAYAFPLPPNDLDLNPLGIPVRNDLNLHPLADPDHPLDILEDQTEAGAITSKLHPLEADLFDVDLNEIQSQFSDPPAN